MQRPAQPAESRLTPWHDLDGPALVAVRKRARVFVEGDLHRGLALRDRDAGLQTADRPKRMLKLLRRRGLEPEGEPGVRRIVQEPEAFRHHADDLCGLSVDLHGLPDHVCAAAEPALPDRIAQHHRGSRACPFVSRDGEPAHQRFRAERGEARGRNPVPVQTYCRAVRIAREVHRAPTVEDANGFERRARPIAQQDRQRRRDDTALVRLSRRRHPHVHEVVRLGVGQRLQQRRAREAEDQDVEADPTGQRRHDHGRVFPVDILACLRFFVRDAGFGRQLQVGIGRRKLAPDNSSDRGFVGRASFTSLVLSHLRPAARAARCLPNLPPADRPRVA